MSIYGDIILDHYQYPRNNKKLEKATHSVHVSNPLCGDELDMQGIIENDTIRDVGFHGQGCAICIASASLLTEYAKGKSVEVLRSLKPEFVIGLLHVQLSPNRMKCALLSWEGVIKLVDK